MSVLRKVFVKLVGIIFAFCICLHFTDFSSVAHANPRLPASSHCNQDWTHGPYYGYEDGTVHFADVNGDGMADAIVVNPGGVYVRLSTGNGFGPTQKWTPGAYYGYRDDTVHFADVNGDGQADAVVFNDDGVYVALSTGSSFAAPQKWLNGNSFYGNRGTYLADMIGSRKASLVSVRDDGVYVAYSTGHDFGEVIQDWSHGPYYGNVDGTVQLADVTGDGKADGIVTNDNITTVRPAHFTIIGITGDPGSPVGDFGSNETWSRDADYSWVQYADVTGDGKADAVTEYITGNTGTGIYVEVSDGSQFTGGSKWTTDAYYGNVDGTVHYADVNGDGKADAIVVNTDTVTVRLSNGQQFGC